MSEPQRMVPILQSVVKMPFGYTVTFLFAPNIDTHVRTEWTPDLPVIRDNRARRKFLERYQREREAFATEVRQILAGEK